MKLKPYALPSSLIIACVAGFLALAAILGYTFTNDSGHTGVNPYEALYIFIPVFGLGVHGVRKRAVSNILRYGGYVACSIGMCGIILLILLDKANVLLPYETWIQRGMP
jgi:hypothetical protein